MTGLADPELAGKIAKAPDVLIQYLPSVGIQLDATRVVHIATYQPDVGPTAVARINVAGVAVGALDVLSLVVVSQLAGMAVGADVYSIGRSSPHVGTKKVAL